VYVLKYDRILVGISAFSCTQVCMIYRTCLRIPIKNSPNYKKTAEVQTLTKEKVETELSKVNVMIYKFRSKSFISQVNFWLRHE